VLCAAAAVTAGCGGEDRASSTAARTNVPDLELPSPPKQKQRTSKTDTSTTSRIVSAREPQIVDRPIPFGPKRRAEMAAYSQRHYGSLAWRLSDPRVIVEHYTASTSFSSAYNTFAQDVPDVELHELPGVCSHFIVDTDGTIYRLVPIGTRCRHTVGLNYTAIGIEHVGMSDAEVMGNRAQLRASLRLTRWLRCTLGIKVRNVIGHNESLSSPFHRESVPALRTQTHGDMQRATMTRYRTMLAADGC
jgi:beta-N-acetylhexosaminidase